MPLELSGLLLLLIMEGLDGFEVGPGGRAEGIRLIMAWKLSSVAGSLGM